MSITIYVFAVTDFNNMNSQYVVINGVYDAIVLLTYPVPLLT